MRLTQATERGMSEPTRFAVLLPYAARWLLNRLHGAEIDSGTVRLDAFMARQGGYESQARSIEEGWRQLQAAAAQAAPHQPVAEPISAGGNAEVTIAEIGPGLDHELSTGAAGDALGLTARRVRQLVTNGSLRGRRVGVEWLVDADSVRLYASFRSAS